MRQGVSSFEIKSSQSFGPLHQGDYLCPVPSAREGPSESAHGGVMAEQKGNCCWLGEPKSTL